MTAAGQAFSQIIHHFFFIVFNQAGHRKFKLFALAANQRCIAPPLATNFYNRYVCLAKKPGIS